MKLQTFLAGLLLICLFLVVGGCVKEEIGEKPVLENIIEEERPKIVEEPGGKLGLFLVEGDKESWQIKSSEIGEYVLSPSWFRFEYESGINELPPIISCKQFGSLEDAKNTHGPISKAVKEYAGKTEEGYTLIFSEKGKEETMVKIDVILSTFPPKGYAIYKYGLGGEIAEEKSEPKKEGEKSKAPPKEAKQVEILTQEQKEIIKFLEAEDEQFDSPALNKILADFRVNYFYNIPEGNSFTNKEVIGYKHWDMDMRNLQDGGGEPVAGLGATFATDLTANNWKKEDAIKTGPPSYVFSYDDVPQEEAYIGGGFRPSPYIEFNKPVSFTPGFDASRSADKTIFSAPGIQTLTLTVTPREKDIEEKSDGMNMCVYTIEPDAENLVDVIITSPTTDGRHFEVSEDKHSLRIYDIPVETDTPWSIDLTFEVTPKPGVSKVKFLPFVSFLWNPASFRDDPSAVSCAIEGTNSGSKGTTEGSSVSCAVEDIGVWKWKAKGNYIWDWRAGLCAQSVAFEHLQQRIDE